MARGFILFFLIALSLAGARTLPAQELPLLTEQDFSLLRNQGFELHGLLEPWLDEEPPQGTDMEEEPQPFFPLMRSWAKGAKLPRPFGIGFTYYHQKQDYDLDDLKVNLAVPLPKDLDIENTIEEKNIKLDLWVLPFLNISGILGIVDGETEIRAPQPIGKIEADYDGYVYGGGLVLVGGVEPVFGSLDVTYTETDLDTSSSTVTAWVFSPKVGVHFEGVTFWTGAMYQDIDEEHEGDIFVQGFGQVEYDVKLKQKNPWNYLLGTEIEITKSIYLQLEGGIGNRKHAMATVVFRF